MFQNNPYVMGNQSQYMNPYAYYGQNIGNYNNYQPGQINGVNQQYNQLNEVIAGTIVDSEDVVKSKNCALDGSSTYYPLSDKSAIYVKQLNPQTGAGMMLKYKLEDKVNEQNTEITQYVTLLSSFKEEIFNEINELKGMIEKQTAAPTASASSTKPRSITGGSK